MSGILGEIIGETIGEGVMEGEGAGDGPGEVRGVRGGGTRICKGAGLGLFFNISSKDIFASGVPKPLNPRSPRSIIPAGVGTGGEVISEAV